MGMTPEPLPPAGWSDPVQAYASDRYAMSPYLHYFQGLRIRRDLEKGVFGQSGANGAYFQLDATIRALTEADSPLRVIATSMSAMFKEFLEDPAGVLSKDSRNNAFDPGRTDNFDDIAHRYLPEDGLPLTDDACIIAVIDDAIPFVHQQFTLPGNRSRVASVWLQDARHRSKVGTDLPTGAEWRGAELSQMLSDMANGRIADEDAIYRRTGAVDMTRPAPPSGAFATGHGAAVAPLAAGFDPAPEQGRNHPLIAVCLPPRITADSMGVLAPVPILTGIMFIISRACGLCRFIEKQHELQENSVELPVVINLSLGLTAGPRDGSSPLERFMDAVSAHKVKGLGRIHFVLPSGNHRQGRLRARLKPGQQVGWRLPPDDPTINAIECWGPRRSGSPAGGLKITVTAPGLAPATTAFTAPRQFSVLTGPNGTEIARAYYTPTVFPDGTHRDGIVVIAIPTCPERLGEPFAPPGEWQVGIAQNMPEGDYDLSAQRDEVIRGFRKAARQSWFHDLDYRAYDQAGRPILTDQENGGNPKVIRADTVNTYATGEWPLRAGAVYRQTRAATIYCSLLPDGQPGDCLAPVDTSVNHSSMIVRGRDSGGFTLTSGTSMAAPQLARWLAGQLAGGQRPDSRAAIRALATQPGSPDPTPIVDFPTGFGEF